MILPLVLMLAAPADGAPAPGASGPRTVLFVCTGNYYRSRLAEAVFNHEAARRGLGWRACSRGVRRGPLDEGQQRRKLSPHTRAHLDALGISIDRTSPEPAKATPADFARADCVIALSGREHRPLIETQFDAAGPVIYWDHDDVQDRPAAEVMPAIVDEVRRLVAALADGHGPTGVPAF